MDYERTQKKLLNREPLSNHLPYIAYDQEKGLFALDHGVGFCFECSPQQFMGQEITQSLKGLLEAELPPKTSIQVLLWASQRIKAALDSYVMLRETSTQKKIFSDLASRQAEFLMAGRDNSIIKGSKLLVRNFRLVVSVLLPSGKVPGRFIEVMEHASRAKETVRQFLTSAFLAPRDFDADDLIQLLYEILNPGHDPDAPVRYNPDVPLSEQILFSDNAISIEPDHLLIDGKHCRSFTARLWPETWTTDKTMSWPGDMFYNTRQISVPFFVSFNIEYPDIPKLKGSIQKKGAVISYQAFGPFMKWFPKIALAKQNFDSFSVAMEEGQHPIQGWMSIFIFTANEEELAQITAAVQGHFRTNGIILQQDNYIMLPLLLQSLPFGYMTESQNLLRRKKTFTSGNVSEMLPVSSDWKGFGRPAIALVGRRGQLQFFDLFSNPRGGYSGVVVASTGAGKSFFVNEVILSYLGLGSKIWVIDVGRSYEKLCSILDGEFVTFGAGEQSCLNPFSRIADLDEEMPSLKAIVAQMASREALDELSLALIEEAIKSVFIRKGQDMTISDVADYLLASADIAAHQIGTRLFPYTRDGAYAVYFEGVSSLRQGKEFTVFELEDLKSKKDLQEVVLLALIYQIQQQMMEREQFKLLIVDEAWDLLTGGNTTTFMENGYRRFRKYQGACLAVTQGINDFYKIPAGQAILENSDFLFLLRQRPESIEALKKSQRISLSDGFYELLKSVHTDTGNYSEIFVYSPIGVTVSRLVVSRYMQLVYTSKADEYTALKHLMSKGLSLTQAIEEYLRIEASGK